MARFDRHAPFDSVGGLPGAAYLQKGRYFNQGGFEVELYKEGAGTENERTMARVKADAQPSLTADEEDEIQASVDADIPVEQLHWRKLKVLVETYGGKWTNRDDGISFLKGMQEQEAAE